MYFGRNVNIGGLPNTHVMAPANKEAQKLELIHAYQVYQIIIKMSERKHISN